MELGSKSSTCKWNIKYSHTNFSFLAVTNTPRHIAMQRLSAKPHSYLGIRLRNQNTKEYNTKLISISINIDKSVRYITDKKNSVLTCILCIDVSRYFFTAQNCSCLFENDENP